MKIFKAFMLIFVFTLIGLVYVHQQIELVKLSYAIESGQKRVSVLLDQHEKLVYNLDNLTAPRRMEGVLIAKNIKVEYPHKEQVIKVAMARKAHDKRSSIVLARARKKGVIDNLLEFAFVGQEAQAKER